MEYKVFGCKVNKYYTDAWLNSDYMQDKSGIFVASCVVTDSAKRKWVRFVKKSLQHLTETQKVFISGCGAFKDGKAQENFFELYPELASAKEKIEILDESPNLTPTLSSKERERSTNKEKSTISRQNTSLLTGFQSPLRKETERNGLGEQSQDKEKTYFSPLSLEERDGGRGTINLSKLSAFQKKNIYTRKYILIQGGCDSFCTFCLTVVKRGKHFYRSAEDIVREIVEFEEQGGKEVVLTGVNLSAWGLENTHALENFSSQIEKNGIKGGDKSRFAELLEYILKNTIIPRIRISSLGPEFITDAVLKVFENERIYPHFHFSLQSGSSKVLERMARHYNGDYIKTLLQKTLAVKRKDGVDISIGADIIVGFPGESDADFEETYSLVRDCKISKLHAFPFSAHTLGESVPAGSFKNQVDEKSKKERMERLLELGEENRKKFYESQKGKVLKVLMEKVSPSFHGLSGESHKQTGLSERVGQGQKWSGWSQNYLEANETNFEIESGEIKKNQIVIGRFT